MKVICINDADDGDSDPRTPIDPVVGDTLFVKDIVVGYGSVTGRPYACYMFQETGNNAYHVKDFAPVSDIDETELIRNYNKELA